MIKYLSYYISNETLLYGNGKEIHFSPDKEMIKGDNCNTINLAFPNHSGTHIDFPYHFNPDGKTLNDYPATYWQFDLVELIDLSGKLDDGQIIGPEIFSSFENSDGAACTVLAYTK